MTYHLCQHTSLPTDGANCKDTIRNEPNCVRFARENAQTMSFVERGFERLGLDRQAVDFSRCVHTRLSFPSPLESFSWRWAGRLLFLAIFPSLLFRLHIFPFILACVHYPSSTYRVNLSKADTCPISPYPKSLGMVVKAKECGSVRFRALNGSSSSFP